VAASHTDYPHPYLTVRPVKRVGFIVVSSDKGLCGGLNVNLFKKVLLHAKDLRAQGIEVDLAVFGHRAEHFFKRGSLNIVASKSGMGEKPSINQLIGSITTMLKAYEKGEIDRIELFSNRFINTITQKPVMQTLVPAAAEEGRADTSSYSWDYIYEPSAAHILDRLLKRYIESQVYQAVIENVACEQAARMIAMKNASDNATEVIGQLKLEYNKARQAAITRELAEIVSGSEAIKK
jgi:F-type H+-transporting ATPase subunit gamma